MLIITNFITINIISINSIHFLYRFSKIGLQKKISSPVATQIFIIKLPKKIYCGYNCPLIDKFDKVPKVVPHSGMPRSKRSLIYFASLLAFYIPFFVRFVGYFFIWWLLCVLTSVFLFCSFTNDIIAICINHKHSNKNHRLGPNWKLTKL